MDHCVKRGWFSRSLYKKWVTDGHVPKEYYKKDIVKRNITGVSFYNVGENAVIGQVSQYNVVSV